MIQKNIVSFNSLLCGYTDSFHLVAVVCFERLDFIFGQNLVSDFTLKKLNMWVLMEMFKLNNNTAETNYTVRRNKETCIYFGQRFLRKDLIQYQCVIFPSAVKVWQKWLQRSAETQHGVFWRNHGLSYPDQSGKRDGSLWPLPCGELLNTNAHHSMLMDFFVCFFKSSIFQKFSLVPC